MNKLRTISAAVGFLLTSGGIALLTSVHAASQTQYASVAMTGSAQPQAAPPSPPGSTSESSVSGSPQHITIPSVGVDAAVETGLYDNETMRWTLTEDRAFHAYISAPANNISGTTYLYGHNSAAIFGNIRNVTPGATATVTTHNGYTFKYRLLRTEAVSPDQIHPLVSTDTPTLALQTCTGMWNELRFIAYFELTTYEKLRSR